MIPAIFARNVPGSYEALRDATIGIAGCGGLGSNAAVALARSGIGRLILADDDLVEESNLNRQYYFQNDVGKKKVDVLASRLIAINPQIRTVTHDRRLAPADIAPVFRDAEILIEAFDRADAKAWLCEAWRIAFPLKPLIGASGVSGVGGLGALRVRKTGSLYLVGDGESEMSGGLNAARVAIAANMQASIAIALLMGLNPEN